MHSFNLLLRRLGARAVHAAVLSATAFAAPTVEAHDFWIQPGSFFAAVDGTTTLTLQAGHGPDRQRSPIPLGRITRFLEVTPLGEFVDLRAQLHPGMKDRDGSARLQIPGVHVLFLQTDNRAQSRLPAGQFNAYLREEGLAPALAHRANGNGMDQDGAERYSRVAKALIQVGPAGKGGQDQAGRELGLPLEIVLDRSPYLEPRTALLPIHVIYEGRPLAGGLVKLTNLDDDAAPLETQLTDAAGRANFRMPPAGNWLLNIVWTKPTHTPDGMDFDTIFSSLSFGVAKILR